MKLRLPLVLILAGMAFAAPMEFVALDTLPAKWTFSSVAPAGNFEAGVDAKVQRDGKSSVFLKTATGKPKGIAYLREKLEARDYVGKRVQITRYARCQEIDGRVGVFVRIEREGKTATWRAAEQRLTDTMDWTPCVIVMDVPKDAVALSLEIGINGSGMVWASDYTLEVVPGTVPLTRMYAGQPIEPQNLDFEK